MTTRLLVDSLSDVIVKLYYMEPLRIFQAMHPEVDLQVFFDDMQMTARGSRKHVIKVLKNAATTLKKFITDEMGAVLAADKASVTATCPKLADLLRDAIGKDAGPRTRVAQFLGIDSLLGRRRGVLGKTSQIRARINSAVLRKVRLKRLAQGMPKGSSSIFTSGVQPAATYGADVLGLSDSELAKLQAVALSSMKPATKGRSKAAVFAVKGDPHGTPRRLRRKGGRGRYGSTSSRSARRSPASRLRS